MANYKQHCEYTTKLFGVSGEDIHRWIDEPRKEYGIAHRNLRHNFFHELPNELRSKYGNKLSHLIFISHLDLDAVEDVEGFIANAMPYKYMDTIAYLRERRDYLDSAEKKITEYRVRERVRKRVNSFWSFQKVKKRVVADDSHSEARQNNESIIKTDKPPEESESRSEGESAAEMVCPKCGGTGRVQRTIHILFYRKTTIIDCDRCTGLGHIRARAEPPDTRKI